MTRKALCIVAVVVLLAVLTLWQAVDTVASVTPHLDSELAVALVAE